MSNSSTNQDMINILIADDEESIRELLAIGLHDVLSDRVSIHEASNGKLAIDLLTKNKFDLCILDIKMPICSGLDVYDFLVNKEKDYEASEKTPVMILSGYLDKMEEQGERKSSILGLKHIISKPFLINEFIERVKRILKVA